MKRRPAAVALVPVASGEDHLRAQSRTPERCRDSASTEVAGSKPADSSDPRTMVRFGPGGRSQATGVMLKLLMRVAYEIHDFQLVGSAPWAKTSRWESGQHERKIRRKRGDSARRCAAQPCYGYRTATRTETGAAKGSGKYSSGKPRGEGSQRKLTGLPR